MTDHGPGAGRRRPGMRLVGVIGSPIAHSLSPLLHNAAFAALGIGCDVALIGLRGGARGGGGGARRHAPADISGLSVTMPHKADVADLVDECTEVARRLGAVNCIVNTEGVLLGTNTDGEGSWRRWPEALASRRPGGGAS